MANRTFESGFKTVEMQEVDDKSYTFTSPHHGQSPHNTRLPGHRSSPHGHRHLLFTTRQLTPTPPPSPLIRRPSWKAQQDFTPSTAQGFPSHFASAGQASSSRQHDTTFSFLPNFPLHTSYDQVNHNHRPEEVTATPSNREFTGSPLELPSITDLYSITPTLLSPLPPPPSPPSRGPSADSLFGTADWRPPPDRGVRFIDLTGDSPPADAMPAMSIRRTTSNLRPARLRSPVYSNPAKRRKLSSEAVKVEQKEIPHIDLRDVDDENDLSKALQREQVAAIKAQQEQTDRPLKLANLQCIICMEPMTDMSVTHCGKLSMPFD